MQLRKSFDLMCSPEKSNQDFRQNLSRFFVPSRVKIAKCYFFMDQLFLLSIQSMQVGSFESFIFVLSYFSILHAWSKNGIKLLLSTSNFKLDSAKSEGFRLLLILQKVICGGNSNLILQKSSLKFVLEKIKLYFFELTLPLAK